MGNHVGKREHSTDKSAKNAETKVEEAAKESPKAARLTQQSSEDNEVFGEADVNQNNGTSTKSPAVTDSKGTADPKNAWPQSHPADTAGRPHLIRLFSRDAPGREDNTFKDRPSESDELQTIQEDSAAASENSDLMASQKRSSFRHGSKMASASTIDHARHGSPRHRDSGLLDSLGRFFGGDRHVPRRGFGKVSPRTPPPMQAKGRGLSLTRFSWGGEGHKPGYGSGKFYEHKSAHKGHKGSYHEGQGTLSKIFKLGGSGSRPGSRSGSPVARR
uniref:Myelin basic protein n=1 Tax=Coturnix japonica TaxID=93934 RepID=A0A8C2T8K3_COTJA